MKFVAIKVNGYYNESHTTKVRLLKRGSLLEYLGDYDGKSGKYWVCLDSDGTQIDIEPENGSIICQ